MSKKETSKFIALILRHKPEAIGITLDEHGWADVEELIAGVSRKHPLDRELLEEIVRTDEKQRFAFNEDHTRIRANQGHSISVDVELKKTDPPAVLYHGTGEKYVASIRKQGLVPKSRLYVHLSGDKETAVNVGKRHGKPVVFIIDARKMREDGYEFFLSANGVWLTEKVPAQYLIEEHNEMKTWLNATYDDIMQEVEPGVVTKNQHMINQLNWTSWLMHMGDLVSTNTNQYKFTTREHFDSLVFVTFGEFIRASENREPPYEEMDAYINSPDAQLTIDHLTQATIRLTKENWPEFRDRICQEADLDPKLFQFEFEDE